MSCSFKPVINLLYWIQRLLYWTPGYCAGHQGLAFCTKLLYLTLGCCIVQEAVILKFVLETRLLYQMLVTILWDYTQAVVFVKYQAVVLWLLYQRLGCCKTLGCSSGQFLVLLNTRLLCWTLGFCTIYQAVVVLDVKLLQTLGCWIRRKAVVLDTMLFYQRLGSCIETIVLYQLLDYSVY